LNDIMNPWDIDSELNNTWIEQANNVWKSLKQDWVYFDIIVSSSLQRASKTAEIIAGAIWYKWEIIKMDVFKERYVGIFKDYYKKQFLEEFWVKNISSLLEKFPNKVFEWVEKTEDFQNRINKAMKYITNNIEYSGKRILIVAHWGVGRLVTWIDQIDNCKLVKINN